VWTGFDYRGEPTPFNRWPSVSSSFGLMDSCGFAKDEFFYYKAWWDPAPQVHLLPHWTWPGREGQPIDIWCYANVDRVELYVNGVSLGSKPVVRGFHLSWTAAYAPGAIEAHGFQGERLVIKDRRETAGLPARLFLSSDRTRLKADGADLAVITIAVADDHGRPSPDADCAISLEIIGPAAVLGMGNGNPTSHEPDRTDQRKAFKGLCMGLVQTQSEAGRIQVRATSDGIKSAELILESV
jgi:beta-galactosidase